MKAPRLSLLTLCIVGGLAQGQAIRIDGSTGVAAQTLKGPDYQIDQSLGRLAGANLFHSFQFFSLSPQETATFTTQQAGIAHVISRVTGGTPSLLAGAIRLQAAAGTPALYFINPAGVLFGEGVSLDVPGGFHVSTAAQLRMADGSRWESSGGDSFSSAAPEAFGFLGAAAPVQLLPGAVLSGAPGQAVQLAAGDLLLDGASLGSSGGLRLAAVGHQVVDLPLQGGLPLGLGGDISLRHGALAGVVVAGAAAGAPLELSAGSLQLESGAGLASQTLPGSSGSGPALLMQLSGNLLMSGGSYIETIGSTVAASGSVLLQASAALLSEEAYFWTRNLGGGAGGSLLLQLGSGLLLSDGASLYSSSQGAGAGGMIEVQAPLIFLNTGAYITSVSFDAGAGGAVRLDASETLSVNAASVNADAQGSGAGGALLLRSAGELSLLGGASLLTTSLGPARAGAIQLQASTLDILGGSQVSSASLETGAGNGDITLSASDRLTMDSGASLRLLNGASGIAGNLLLEGGSIVLQGGAYLANSGLGAAQRSGNIRVQASGSITLQDAELITLGVDAAGAGHITVLGQDLLLTGASRLSSSAGETGGGAGNIALQASRSLRLAGTTSLSSSTSSAQDAGQISLAAGSISMEDEASISAISLGGTGRGGDIDLRATGELRLGGSSVLISSTTGAGAGGNVLLQGQSVHLQDSFRSLTNASGAGGGQGGNLNISASGAIHLGDSVKLDASTFSSSGSAGQIQLKAGGEIAMQGSALITSFSAGGSGSGGSVLLQSATALRLDPGSGISTSAVAQGDAGGVRLMAPQIALNGAEIRSNTLGSGGDAGLIEIHADRELLLSGNSRVSSSTLGGGAAGQLSLQGSDILMSGGSSVLAFAAPGSSAQTGSVTLQAQQRIRVEGGSTISIANSATVADPAALQGSLLRLQAPAIELDAATLSAAAFGNTKASGIELLAGERLLLSDSIVSTAAQDGDGGSLRAEAGKLLWLKRSALVTSVFGAQGDGGDIDIKTGLLFLDGGFIQANTAAANASGGDVRIDTGALVASGNRVVIGGDAALVFDPLKPLNVIQAAAPNGVSGAVAVANTLDIAGNLALLDRSLLDPGGLGRSPCDRRGGGSLAAAGHGRLPTPLLSPLGAPPTSAPPPPLASAGDGRLWGDCR